MSDFKNKVLRMIQFGDKNSRESIIFNGLIISLIIVNISIVFIETFDLSNILRSILYMIEIFSVIIFSIEYILRVWVADLVYPDLPPAKARVKYIFSFMALIDLLAILPFYIPFLIPFDLKALRSLRLIRLLRLFKMKRYVEALSTIGTVLRKKANQLISSMFVVLLLMIMTSVLMYHVENEAQPDKFKNAFDSMWWAVATFTTVGYGDIYPITATGKVLSSVIALLGIGLVAVPTGIISSGFVECVKQDDKDEKHYCPYCGKDINS